MNGHVDNDELPELTDEDVELLYAICKRASAFDNPPFKALFAAYDDIFAEQQIEQQHDGVVFRYLMRVGESTRNANRERRAVDLVSELKNVIEAHGVTFLELSEEDGQVTGPISRPHQVKQVAFESPRRRNSFDDARFEETWLSEHSEPVNPESMPAPTGLLKERPRRSRDPTSTRRARSISSQRDLPIRSAAPKHFEIPSAESASEPDDQFNPTLLWELSQTQLEQNAEAFLSTSALRSGRQVLHIWRRATQSLQHARDLAYSTAITYDRRTLLKQAFDQWRQTLDDKRQEQSRFRKLDRLEDKATRCRNLFLLTKAFTHWATSCQYEQLRTKVAQRYMLKVTYFKKWRAIANENQTKMRRILARKYLAVWREKVARRLLWQEQALAHYEEILLRKCKTRWFWHFCSRRVEGWHEQWIQKRTLSNLHRRAQARQRLERQAEGLHSLRLVRSTHQSMVQTVHERQRSEATAEQCYHRTLTTKSFKYLHVQAKLAPLEKRFSLQTEQNLERKALRVWSLHLSLSRQAAEVDRKRILQTAWTDWNDALRCQALAQKIDERVLVENLYRWVLQERLKLFQRTTDARLLRRAVSWWVSKVQQERDKLADAEAVFAERQRRRRLAYGMQRLNLAMHNGEDAERTAVEFRNSRALPQVLDIWKEKVDHVRELMNWAADARFYCLCTATLKVWRVKTGEQKQNRKRNAYAHIRARIKFRIVGDCFRRWRTRTAEVHEIDDETERRVQSRTANAAAGAFNLWREKTASLSRLQTQARAIDERKLADSAWAALTTGYRSFREMNHQAEDFRKEVDLTLQAGALRRIQWATFTVARKTESAEALRAWSRDQHIKQMLRHWAGQLAAKRAALSRPDITELDDEPESPTLRPASRAASRSVNPTLPSSPPIQNAQPSTPGYMQTPSRSRRAGRFKPLATPAPFTPMAFNSSYLATTPAPLPGPQRDGNDESMLGLTPQVTPFERKLRAGGFAAAPASALRSVANRQSSNIAGGGTNKSVRFARASRFRNRSDDSHEKTS